MRDILQKQVQIIQPPNFPSEAFKISTSTIELGAKYSSNTIGNNGYVQYRISATGPNSCLIGNNIVFTGTSTLAQTNSEGTRIVAKVPDYSYGTYSWCARSDDGFFKTSWMPMGTFIYTDKGGCVPIIQNNYQAPSVPISTSSTSTKYIFTKNLKIGDVGIDVLNLQKFLNNHGYFIALNGLGSMEQETNYFGKATKEQVKAYQDTHVKDILIPSGLTKGTGYFGTITRMFVNNQP